MLNQQIVVLNGCETTDEDLKPLLSVLFDKISKCDATVQTYHLHDIQMGTCTGCFGCWLKTPGVCLAPDMGREIAQAVLQSDTTILLTPVTFGGYSSAIKKIQDRWLTLLLPYFGLFHGEIHHTPRYAHYPRLVGIGIQQEPNPIETNLFKVLVGRNAINFHAPTHAAEVVLSTATPEELRQQFQTVLTRNDAIPLGKVVTSLMPIPDPGPDDEPMRDCPGRALLLVGSPKVKEPSTSRVLGQYVLDRLQQRGWLVKSLTLRKHLVSEAGQADFLAAIDQADLLIVVFPLYIDALPFLLTQVLEVIAAHRVSHPIDMPQRLVAIANNGFPEAYQNALALAICRQFATATGMTWADGLAMGAGEALFSGLPMAGPQRQGRPPVHHVMQALDLMSDALAEGRGIPAEANQLIAKTPIPLTPFWLWRWLFIKTARQNWNQKAAAQQVQPDDMLSQPYIGSPL